jgi:hypothetical protein
VADCIEGLYLVAERQQKLSAALALNAHVLQWRERHLRETGQLHPRLPHALYNQAVLDARIGQCVPLKAHSVMLNKPLFNAGVLQGVGPARRLRRAV